MHECNIKQIFVGDDISLSVVGSGKVPVENGHFNDVLCVPKISCNFLSVYQITHSGEGKTVMFTPHQVVIKDFKNHQNVLATGTVDDITRLYKFNNFGSSPFSVFVAHSDNLSKLWHERFGHLNYRSLQQLCKDNIVIGILMVSCKDGVCFGCVLKNIIGTVLTNVPLGTPRFLWRLCIVTCVDLFHMLHFLVSNIY